MIMKFDFKLKLFRRKEGGFFMLKKKCGSKIKVINFVLSINVP